MSQTPMTLPNVTLLPCPFCGVQPQESPLRDGGYSIDCFDHDTISVSGNTRAEAIAAWNTRATPPPADELGQLIVNIVKYSQEARKPICDVNSWPLMREASASTQNLANAIEAITSALSVLAARIEQVPHE